MSMLYVVACSGCYDRHSWTCQLAQLACMHFSKHFCSVLGVAVGFRECPAHNQSAQEQKGLCQQRERVAVSDTILQVSKHVNDRQYSLLCCLQQCTCYIDPCVTTSPFEGIASLQAGHTAPIHGQS
jgi:hypothetical protein